MLTTKSIRLTEEEVAELREYLEISGDVEAVALRRAAVRGIRELRLAEAIRLYLAERDAEHGARIAGVPRAQFLCAASPSAEIPAAGRRGSEGMTSGSTAYSRLKDQQDNSMPSKQEPSEDVYDVVLQDPRDRARAALPEPQTPAREPHLPRLQRLQRGHRYTTDPVFSVGTFRPVGDGQPAHSRDRTGQGVERGAYVTLGRLSLWECGMAYGTRVLWSRSPHSSRRSEG